MKTHRDSGDTGCSGVILKNFCSAASFSKLETFINTSSGNKFKSGVYFVRKHFLRWGCVSAKTRFAL